MAVPDNLTREEYLAYGNMAGKGNRFQEMVECAQKLASIAVPFSYLSEDERNFISKVYDAVIQPLRLSWKIYEKEDQQSNNREDRKKLIKTFKSKVESEINSICLDVFNLYTFYGRNPPDLSDEMGMFINKLKGDYLCYSAEIQLGLERKASLMSAETCYKTAQRIGEDVVPWNSLKKELAYSLIFYYSEMCDYDLAAWEVVVKATEEGVLSELDPKGRDLYVRIRDLYSAWEETCPSYPSKRQD